MLSKTEHEKDVHPKRNQANPTMRQMTPRSENLTTRSDRICSTVNHLVYKCHEALIGMADLAGEQHNALTKEKITRYLNATCEE